jgi:protein-S-isoprenylcysteine O-methyltransferase Ste14
MTESPASATDLSLLVRVGNFLFRYRNYAFPILLIPLVVFFPTQNVEGAAAPGGSLDWLALFFAVLGEGLRGAVVGLAYIKRGGVDKRVYAERLVTEGLFTHCRNPLYVGNFLLLLALLAIVNNVYVYVIGGAFFIFAYIAIVAAEENYLRAKFGAEYDEYCRRVNRWIPDFRGLRATLQSMTFNWRRVVIKEYSSVYSCIVVAFLLETIKAYRTPGMESADFIKLGGVFAVITVIFVTIYVLKKSRRLVDRTV